MNNFLRSFQEELITTGLVMIMAVGGSYYFLDLAFQDTGRVEGLMVDESALAEVEQAKREELNQAGGAKFEQADGAELSQELETPRPSPTIQPTARPTASPTPNWIEIPYRPNREYENDDYLLSFSRPRVMVGNGRIFQVDVQLLNKGIDGDGLYNRLVATVLKDGEIIVQQAAMSNSQVKVLEVGEKVTYTASLSLIEGTDVSQVIFDPGESLPQVTYQVKPL